MLVKSLTAIFAVFLVTDAIPTPNSKDGGPIGELPENWDQTKDDTQSLFLNKSDKNDLEPYPLALSEEGNPEVYERGLEQRFDSPQSTGELDNLIMRPELYGEPPAMDGLSAGYESRRRKRGSGTKVGGAGAATKVATKNGSGKKNAKPEEHVAGSNVETMSADHDARRRKRGSGTKVGGAAASAKTATKNNGNKKNFRPLTNDRRKRDSGLSAADVRALLNLWEAQERRKQEYANQWAADRYYGHMGAPMTEDDQAEVDENGDIWYNEPVVIGPQQRDYPAVSPRHSYFSEQNRMVGQGYPGMYQVDPSELAQRVALAACALYGTREKKQPPPCQNNNNYKVAKNGKLHCVEGGGKGGECGAGCGERCGAAQCALCRGEADTDNKQNIEDADDTPLPEAPHTPGLNMEFVKQIISLAKIMVPGVRSHEAAILFCHTMCLFTRTFLSIYVASLEGSIVKHIVQKDMRSFASLLLQWFGIAVPATFINSMIRYLESKLALAFRTRLVNHAYELYFKNQTYYRVSNLDARIENADHRLTEDVSVFTTSVAHLYSSLTKPCFDLLLIVLTLATYSNKMKGNILMGPSIATVVICLTGQLLRVLSPSFGALAGEEARMRANLRHVHARLIAHAEEVAFYGGHKVELGQLQDAYSELCGQMTSVFNKKLWYVMLEQFFMKYVWSGTGMVMLALPILTGTSSGSTTQGISDRAEYMTTSRNLLNSAADAIERLMSSYKEIVTLAGYAERVSDMLVVFSEVARGRCVRAVHVAPPAGAAFSVTFRNGEPVPMGKIIYSDDLAIRLRNVPIVTPACDVVAGGVTLDIEPGSHLLIIGPNGCGKSSLFRIVSGLWPVHGGTLQVPRPCACAACADEAPGAPPCRQRPIMFYLPQRPYMSMGSLIDQVTYPARVAPGDTEAEARASAILDRVHLSACAARHGGLRVTRDWRSTLSGGEKQRMAMARMFYHRPVYALLDECTSAVSMETEVVMYEAAVREGITLLSITHRPSVWKYHKHVLEFDGAGNWSYRPLDKEAFAAPRPPLALPEPSGEN